MARQAYILYFVEGVNPSADEIAEAKGMDAHVVFRNSLAVNPDPYAGGREIADGVMGTVPAAYSDYPTAESGIAAVKKMNDAYSQRFDDKPAPSEAEKGFGSMADPNAALDAQNGPTAIGGPKSGKVAWGTSGPVVNPNAGKVGDASTPVNQVSGQVSATPPAFGNTPASKSDLKAAKAGPTQGNAQPGNVQSGDTLTPTSQTNEAAK